MGFLYIGSNIVHVNPKLVKRNFHVIIKDFED